MNFKANEQQPTPIQSDWPAENTVEIERVTLLQVAEKICQQSRYPLLTLRLLVHIICGVEPDGKIHISARHLARKMDVHYDTVTKCLKYLREIGVIGRVS